MKLTIWSSAVLAMALGGCAPTVNVDAYTASVSEALCERILECCAADERYGWYEGAEDMASCQRAYEATFGSGIQRQALLANDGVFAYAPERLDACLDFLAAASCSEVAASSALSRPLEPCDGIFSPTLENGDVCPQPSACRSGLCPLDTGVCTPVATLGEACTEATIYFSDGSSAPIGVCAAGFCNSEWICEAHRALGDACTTAIECGSLECEGGVCVERALMCDGS